MIRASYQPFTKGQKVWLEGRNLSMSYNKKITTKREGPFLITEVLGPVNYRLKLPDKWKHHDTFHASLLMPYKENDIHGPNFPQPPADLIAGHEEYEVERIIQHRKIRGPKKTWKMEFQVQWKGYEEPTWEPEEHLTNAKDVISDYWTRQTKRISYAIPTQTTHKGKKTPAYLSTTPAKRIKGNLHEHVCEECIKPYQHEHAIPGRMLCFPLSTTHKRTNIYYLL